MYPDPGQHSPKQHLVKTQALASMRDRVNTMGSHKSKIGNKHSIRERSRDRSRSFSRSLQLV